MAQAIRQTTFVQSDGTIRLETPQEIDEEELKQWVADEQS